MTYIRYLLILLLVIIGVLLYFKKINLYIVATSSMEPTIPAKTLVISIPSKKHAVGDIASYKDTNNRIITHRIVNIKNYQNGSLYYFKGDANKYKDPAPAVEHEIIGKTYILISGNILGNKPIILLFYIFTGFLIGKLTINFLTLFGTI